MFRGLCGSRTPRRPLSQPTRGPLLQISIVFVQAANLTSLAFICVSLYWKIKKV